MPDVSTMIEEIIFEEIIKNNNYFIINEIKNIIIDTIKERENIINIKRHYIRELLDLIDNDIITQYNLIENNKYLISINNIFYMYLSNNISMFESILNYVLIKLRCFVERIDESSDLELDNSGKGKIIKKHDDWFNSISRENEKQGIKYIDIKKRDIYNKYNERLSFKKFKKIETLCTRFLK